jgi:superfamily I DNA/RNA helicase
VITPVRAENAPFVQNLIDRVEREPFKKDGNRFGPHKVPWEPSYDDDLTAFFEQLGLPEDPSAIVSASDIPIPSTSGLSKSVEAWLDRMHRIAGRTSFTNAEFQDQVRLIHQRSRAYRRHGSKGIRAMTIHQAKNREFDSVIVLWPYQVTGSPERLRRLLYNAITRAKRQVVVVVQNPRRLEQPPFVSFAGTA